MIKSTHQVELSNYRYIEAIDHKIRLLSIDNDLLFELKDDANLTLCEDKMQDKFQYLDALVNDNFFTRWKNTTTNIYDGSKYVNDLELRERYQFFKMDKSNMIYFASSNLKKILSYDLSNNQSLYYNFNNLDSANVIFLKIIEIKENMFCMVLFYSCYCQLYIFENTIEPWNVQLKNTISKNIIYEQMTSGKQFIPYYIYLKINVYELADKLYIYWYFANELIQYDYKNNICTNLKLYDKMYSYYASCKLNNKQIIFVDNCIHGKNLSCKIIDVIAHDIIKFNKLQDVAFKFD